jgi:hypothetical protein
MGGYDKSDAARDTGASTSQVSAAWHDARDHAADEGGWGVPKDRHGDYDTGGGGCFIATAAFGTPLAPEIDVFRRFRDDKLKKSLWGTLLVHFYERTSPPVAVVVRKVPLLALGVRMLVRTLLPMFRS